MLTSVPTSQMDHHGILLLCIATDGLVLSLAPLFAAIAACMSRLLNDLMILARVKYSIRKREREISENLIKTKVIIELFDFVRCCSSVSPAMIQ